MMKTELDNRKEDFAKQEKMGGDNKVNISLIQIEVRLGQGGTQTFSRFLINFIIYTAMEFYQVRI